MDSKKIRGSSFTNDLFGAKESSQPCSTSTGIFSTIFPTPSSVVGRNSTSDLLGSLEKQSPESQAWSRGTPDDTTTNWEGVNRPKCNMKGSSICRERIEPCPLSSSLYYGGQEDMYVQSSSAQTVGSYAKYKKIEGEDDPSGDNSQSASRGNWWQGSLYY